MLPKARLQLLLAVAPATVLLPLAERDNRSSPSAYSLVLAVGARGGLLGALIAGRPQLTVGRRAATPLGRCRGRHGIVG